MNPLDALKRADEALKKQVEEKNRLKNERDRQYIMDAVAQSLPGMMSPLLHQVSENSRIASDEILSALQSVKIEQPKVDVNVTTPEAKVTVTNEPIKVPEISTAGIESAIERGIARAKFPKPEVNVAAPVVNVEAPEAPEPFDGEVTLKGVDKKRPLPVMMMGPDGNPFQMAQSAGGGRGDFYTIKDIQNSTGGSLIDNDGYLKVTGAFSVSASGSTTISLVNVDGLYYNSDNPLPVTGSFTSTPGLQISGAVDSVNVVDAFGSTAVSGVFNADNRLRVSLETGGSGLTDSELRATSVPVSQVSGSVDSVAVIGTVPVSGTFFQATQPVSVANTLEVVQVSGASNSVNVLNTVTVSGTVATGGLTNTELRATTVDVKQVSGSIDSVSVIGTPTVSVTDIFASVGTNVINPDGRIKVELPSGSSGLTDTELRASHLDVQQVSGAIDSVNVLTMPAVVVTSITNTIAANVVDSSGVAYSGSNPFVISGSVTATGGGYLTDTQLRASTLDVKQVSGSIDSVYLTGIFGTVGVVTINPDGSPVYGGSSGGGTEYAEGATASTYTGTAVIFREVSTDVAKVVSSTDPLPVTLATKLDYTNDTISTIQLSGAIDSVYITGASGTLASNIVNSSGIAYSGSNPVPMTLAVSNATSTINATLVDSAGAYRGTLPVAVVAGSAAIGSVTVNGSTNSVIAVGATLHGVADIGSAPQKVGGIVMQANPTAEVGGDVTNFRADDIGRQITRPMQVRDLIATAYVSVANGTETTLLAAGGAGVFHDLIKVVLSNNSTAAVGVDIRCTTAGNIVFHYEIPANGVVGESLAVPWPQDATNNNWTIDLPDITGTTVTASALFTKEV